MDRKKLYLFNNLNIEEYCNLHCSDVIFERGFDYLNNYRVISDWQPPTKKNDIIVSVQGSKIYDVHVKYFNSSEITTHCNCPYSFGGLCKHEVAALMHIDMTNTPATKVIEIEPNPVTDENCTIWELDKLNEEYLDAFANKLDYRFNEFHDYRFSISKLLAKKIQCKIIPGYNS
ncbi:MAG: hypothetical protein PF541_06180 [Prolixibacteraceae bacterium]|jgi:hypothetical protein|nr:hypothetical protein [Prolixibacteraceae bacterium]